MLPPSGSLPGGIEAWLPPTRRPHALHRCIQIIIKPRWDTQTTARPPPPPHAASFLLASHKHFCKYLWPRQISVAHQNTPLPLNLPSSIFPLPFFPTSFQYHHFLYCPFSPPAISRLKRCNGFLRFSLILLLFNFLNLLSVSHYVTYLLLLITRSRVPSLPPSSLKCATQANVLWWWGLTCSPCPYWLRTRLTHCPSLPPISLIISHSLGRCCSKLVCVCAAQHCGLPLASVYLVNSGRSQWYFEPVPPAEWSSHSAGLCVAEEAIVVFFQRTVTCDGPCWRSTEHTMPQKGRILPSVGLLRAVHVRRACSLLDRVEIWDESGWYVQ